MSSHDTKNPTEGVSMRRVMEPSNPDVHLLERVLSRENMQRAWKRVRANKGAPGIDGMTIEEFPELARQNWDAIRESLLAGTYQPSPVRRVEIPKDTGGTRPLGIPIVLDRLIQQAIAQVLVPIFIRVSRSQAMGSVLAARHLWRSERSEKINPDKSRVARTDDANFLGFTFKGAPSAGRRKPSVSSSGG
jgi:hypothetical protein